MERNKNIEVLRALAIGYIVLYHYANSITGIVTSRRDALFVESLGQFGLITFFVLSGFGTYLSFENYNPSERGYNFYGFIKRRLKAIIPQYYFCIGILLLTTGIVFLNKGCLHYVIETLLLIQNYDIYNGINGVTWTVAVLFQLYFLAIPLYYFVKKSGFWSWAITVIVSVCLKKAIAGFIVANQMNNIYYIVSSIRIPFTTIDLILAGMCAARFSLNLSNKAIKRIRSPKIVIVCAALMLLYHYIFTKGAMQLEWLYGARWINCVWQSAIGLYVAIVCVLCYYLPFTYKTMVGGTTVYCKI